MLPMEIPANVLQMGWADGGFQAGSLPGRKLALTDEEEALFHMFDTGPLLSHVSTCGFNSESAH